MNETTGTSPFFANYGFHPQLGVEPTKPRPPNLSEAQKRQFYKANIVAEQFDHIITQLKALAHQSIAKYEDYANESRSDSPRYLEGQEVYLNTKNMKTNRPMKKGDDKMSGPHKILKVYPRACLLELPAGMRIYPVFHNSLLVPKNQAKGLPGQSTINEAESRHLQGRVLERDDDTEEIVEKWYFEKILDSHNESGLQYLVKWQHHAATWQPAKDLKGQEEAIWAFHRANPGKPGPPAWAGHDPTLQRSLQNRLAGIDSNFSSCLGHMRCMVM